MPVKLFEFLEQFMIGIFSIKTNPIRENWSNENLFIFRWEI